MDLLINYKQGQGGRASVQVSPGKAGQLWSQHLGSDLSSVTHSLYKVLKLQN